MASDPTNERSAARQTEQPPSEVEKAAINRAQRAVAAREPRVTVRFTQRDSGKVDLDGAGHSDHEGWLVRLENAFSTHGRAFALSSLNQLMTAARDGEGQIDETRVNSMLAIVEGAKPESELQAALAIQMAIIHFATTTLLSRTMRADQLRQFDAAGNMAVKLARTFAVQAETLAKLQRKGEQVVKVVHVHAGGKAIVGSVSTGATGPGGGGVDENGSQPHAKAIAAAAAPEVLPPMWSKDEEREPVPVTRREG